MIEMRKELVALLMLILVTFFWGLTFPVIHVAVAYISPAQFVFWRFLLAAIILLFFVRGHVFKTGRATLVFGLVLAVLNCGTYVFQTIGLESISAARSAFITGTSVVMVPLLALLFKMSRPGLWGWVASFVCLTGLYILTGAHLSAFNSGDFWTLACALCVALTILVIQLAGHYTCQMGLLTFHQIAFTVLLLLPFQGLDHPSVTTWGPVVGAIAYCAIFATVIALFLQVKYQRDTTASRAALIFTLEPVFASIFSILLKQEKLSWTLVVGGSVMTLSILLLAFEKDKVSLKGR